MISYIKGKVISKDDKFLVLENHGIGFRIFCTEKTMQKIEVGDERRIYSFLYFREEKIVLYGFLTFQELELFSLLKSMSGVGPKSALALSSFGSLKKLKTAIEMSGQDSFKAFKGIGKKRLQKILLELTGKISEVHGKEEHGKEDKEAEGALMNLGFSRDAARKALSRLPDGVQSLEDKVREALKILGR